MPRTKTKLTYADYAATPEDVRYELLEGELVMVPSPNTFHQDVVGNLYAVLRAFVSQRSLGRVFVAPCDVVLSEHNVVQPDLLFVSRGRSRIITRENVQGAPDLVIEVVSPNTQHKDRIGKRLLYERYGVREFWLVELEAKTIEVLVLEHEQYRTLAVFDEQDHPSSPLLPDLVLPVAQVFQVEAQG